MNDNDLSSSRERYVIISSINVGGLAYKFNDFDLILSATSQLPRPSTATWFQMLRAESEGLRWMTEIFLTYGLYSLTKGLIAPLRLAPGQ